ncbi:MAG: flagellar FlbD family protein [Clostridia bacterium]|jgi:flagellar protein FlbD|nr:flagellar FlbD family protein [Clostridia bacterium]
MITVKKLNGSELVVNADLIETAEQTPDTIITLSGGKKLVVCETPQEIIDLVIAYKRKIMLKF